jgi:8-oxo-dGTP diphosphatase
VQIPSKFNIRVYGIWIQNNQVLLSKESSKDLSFIKFPGGGLEWGEGTEYCLKREWQEELGVTPEIEGIFYINGFFQPSIFNPNDQLLSLYYLIANSPIPAWTKSTEHRHEKDWEVEAFWHPIAALSESQFMFPIDKVVVNRIKEKYENPLPH